MRRWQKLLASYGLNEADLKEHLRTELQVMNFIEVRLRPNVHVQEEDVEAYYQSAVDSGLAEDGRHGDRVDRSRAEIRELLTQQRMDEMLDAWLHNLRQQSHIQTLIPLPALNAGLPAQPGREVNGRNSSKTAAVGPDHWAGGRRVSAGRNHHVGLYLGSAGFGELVRERVIAELEAATGGRVDLQSLHWNLWRLQLEANDLVVYGLEPSNQAPLARIGKVRINAHIISLLRRQVDLTYVELQQPQIHLIVGPDGKTNIPAPKVKTRGRSGATAVRPCHRTHGVEPGRAPGERVAYAARLLASDITTSTRFDTKDKRYDGTLSAGKIAAKI